MKIDELHDKLFELLLTVDRICTENNIRYFVAYGTSIGAVREKDFIPWDDDMDIMILAEDYPRFREAMRRNLPEHIHFIEPSDFERYHYDFGIRIIDDREKMRKETEQDTVYQNYPNRMCIDVFVAAGCPSRPIGRKLFIIKNKIIHGMAIQYRFKQDYSKYSAFQKVQVTVLRVMGAICSGSNKDRIVKKWFRLFDAYDAEKTGWRYVLNAPLKPHYQKTMPDAWFRDTAYGRIRDKEVRLIGGYDGFLRTVYGDYMRPERDTEKYFTHLDEGERYQEQTEADPGRPDKTN